MDLTLDGLDDLQESLAKAINKYPDIAEERLEKTAKNFKKRVVQITKSAVESHTGNLIKGFKLDKVHFYGANMQKDFRGTAPHFHLIENGHEQVTKDGKNIGWIPGYQIVGQARNEYADIMPEVMKELLTDITKVCDL